MRSKNKTKTSFPTSLPSSRAQLHSRILYLLPPGGIGGREMGIAVTSSHVVSATSYLSTLFP